MNVKSKQCLLYAAGYDPGPLDGVDGPKTQAAMQDVFDDYGVGEDGLIGILAGTVPKRKKPKSFWDETPNFRRKEFACPCPRCGGFPEEPAQKLILAAQQLRNEVGRPIYVTSGVRCQKHNDELPGSVPNSRHLIGHAMDFRVEGMLASEVLPLALSLRDIVFAYEIDEYHIHMDIGD